MSKQECPICKMKLTHKKTLITQDITMMENRYIDIYFCANCNQEYIKNISGEFVKGIN